jgi:hypothetical protein
VSAFCIGTPELFMIVWVCGWACLLAVVLLAVMLTASSIGARRHERYVREKGEPVVAWVVQANNVLYQPGDGSRAAQALITFETIPDVESYMAELIGRIGKLKDTTPADPTEAEVARLVTDETYKPFGRHELPRTFTGGREVFSVHVWVERELLPAGYLDRPFVRAIAVRDDDDSRVLMAPY